MDESEVLILIVAGLGILAGIVANSPAAMHRLYFRDNPGPGLVRAAILLSLAWIWLVTQLWADESVEGVYVLFYLVLGYAAVKVFGQTGARLFGLRMRIDVLERRNLAAAQVLAAFVLATGLIFGGSLWGDADPVGDDEGGWWIVWAFFLLGWVSLVCAFGLFLQREKGRARGWGRGIRRNRDMEAANAASLFLLAAGLALTDAVSGDFWGWRHGLLTFGVLAGLLLTHEIFAGVAGAGRGKAGAPTTAAAPGAPGTAPDSEAPGRAAPDAAPASGTPAPVTRRTSAATASPPVPGARTTEGLVYLFLAVAAWGLNRLLDAVLGGG